MPYVRRSLFLYWRVSCCFFICLLSCFAVVFGPFDKQFQSLSHVFDSRNFHRKFRNFSLANIIIGTIQTHHCDSCYILFLLSLLFSAMKSITQKLMQERSTQKYIEHQITKRMFDYFISNFFNFDWDWLFVFWNKTIDYFVLWVSLFKLPPTLFEQRNNKRKKRFFFSSSLQKKCRQLQS